MWYKYDHADSHKEDHMTNRVFIATGVLLTILSFGCGKKISSGKDLVISVSPSTVTFGFVPQGTTREKTVTITNAGTADGLKIYSASLKSGSSRDFTVTVPAKAVLNAGESTTFKVVYKPSDCKTDRGNILIDSNAPSGVYTVPVIAAKPDIRIDAVPGLGFGNVTVGKTKTIDTVLVNTGSINFLAKSVQLSANTSEYFKILSIGTKDNQSALLPMTMDPNADANTDHAMIPMVVQFAPREAGEFNGNIELLVKACNPDTGATREDTLTVPLSGTGIGPKVVAFPGVLDFGRVVIPNKNKPLELTVSNQGSQDLIIDVGGVHPTPGSDPDLKVVDPLTEKLTLKPTESHVFHISWTPSKPAASASGDLGGIAIDGQGGVGVVVPARGLVDAPMLELVPAKVDFGFVGQNVTVKKSLTFKNVGHADLIIHSIALQGDANNEFKINPNMTIAAETTIKGNDQKHIQISFTNKGGASGDASATLVVSSNSATGDPTNEDLIAHRAGSPNCKPVLSPPVLNYGVVAEQMSKTLTMHLRNAGTGPCTFKGAGVWDCSSMMGLGTTCPEPFGGGYQSANYRVLFQPPQIVDGLQPGGQLDIPIKFMPPSQGSIFGQFNEFDGLFAVKVYNRFAQPPDNTKVYPAGTAGGFGGAITWTPNLIGKSGISNVTVMPSTVDFGMVTIGCYSRTFKVCVYNTGTAAVDINNIKLDNCSPEFHLKKVPGLPFNVSAGTPLCFETNYSPVDETADACNISIASDNSMILSVGLTGSGTYDTHQIDKFTQVSGQTVDILFVIDDSGSMSDKQQKLKDNFDRFINHADVWKNDYHLGVISVCAEDSKIRGKLNVGAPNKIPRFITPTTPNGRDLFKKYVFLGDNSSGGCSDKRESGLEAAQAALSAPLTSDTGKACTKDADCTGDQKICPNANNCAYSCIDGTCAGWNKGFLRKDAQLEVLVLSDEEDQSNGSISFYTNFFKSIKGFYNTNMFHWNSITGVDDRTGDCSQGCSGSDGSSAEHGCRYTTVSQDTNGKVGSICDTDYAAVMDAIGSQAFGLKMQFFLTRLADPPTIKVGVKGTNCGAGYLKLGEPSTPGWNWRYDQPSNSVIFEEGGKCTPQPGDKITIEYDTLCLTE